MWHLKVALAGVGLLTFGLGTTSAGAQNGVPPSTATEAGVSVDMAGFDPSPYQTSESCQAALNAVLSGLSDQLANIPFPAPGEPGYHDLARQISAQMAAVNAQRPVCLGLRTGGASPTQTSTRNASSADQRAATRAAARGDGRNFSPVHLLWLALPLSFVGMTALARSGMGPLSAQSYALKVGGTGGGSGTGGNQGGGKNRGQGQQPTTPSGGEIPPKPTDPPPKGFNWGFNPETWRWEATATVEGQREWTPLQKGLLVAIGLVAVPVIAAGLTTAPVWVPVLGTVTGVAGVVFIPKQPGGTKS